MKLIRDFLNSKYFIILTYLVALVCWRFQTQIPAIIYSGMAIILIIIFDAKRIGLITIIFAGIINYRDTAYETNFWPLLIVGGIVAPFTIYDLVRRKASFKDPIFIALALYLLANIISLINITKENLNYGLVGILQTLAFCFLYFYVQNTKEEGDYRRVAESAVYMLLTIALQVLIFLLTYEGEVLGKNIVLGWSASNSLAMVFMLLFPMTVFLYVEKEKYYILPLIVVNIALVVLTLSKGAYLTLALLLIPLLVFVYKYVKDKRKLTKSLIIMFALALLAFGIIFSISGIREGIVKYLQQMSARGWFNDQARIRIYKYGAEVFKEFPLFGSGSYTAKPYLIAYGYSPSLKHYHNFIIQNVATLGLFGLVTFGNFIVQIFRKIKGGNFYHLSVFFATLAMLIHGLVDNTWHNPVIFVIILIYLAALDATQNKLTSIAK
ncbi:MAG: O-antigen ligase family protein [Bacilli bacterium]|jgi:O-antigen ligase